MFMFSNETGEAKIWLEPEIGLAQNYGLSLRRLAAALRLAQEHEGRDRAGLRRLLCLVVRFALGLSPPNPVGKRLQNRGKRRFEACRLPLPILTTDGQIE
jgi:hypothetical protein